MSVPVALWWAPLDVGPALAHRLAGGLDDQERRRAAALQRPIDRTRFQAAHGWLRELLGRELGCPPADVPIVSAPGEKPRLRGGELRFSAARRDAVALYAVSWTAEVGVDIETIAPGVDTDALGARFFSVTERAALASLPESERRAAAIGCWTRKEAYGKAIGVGLAFEPRDVTLWAAGDRPVVTGDWSVQPVDLGSGLAAAVAVAGRSESVAGKPRRLVVPNREG